MTSPDAEVDRLVPVTPAWRVRDVVAHVIGVGEDLLAENYPDFSDPKGMPAQAQQREAWTEAQVQRRRDRSVASLVEEWESLGVEAALAAGPEDTRYPFLSRIGATFDLACHLHDVRHALGTPGDQDSPVTRVAFWMARSWLDLRLQSAQLGPLRLSAPGRDWDLGGVEPVAVVAAPPFELFRAISGRRSGEQILAMQWTGDPEPLLDVLSPYPQPEVAVVE